MIFQSKVKEIAKAHLKNTLKEYAGKFKFLTEGYKFEKFCELCTMRLLQLDTAGYVKSQFAIEDFIKQAAIAYALKQLELQEDNLAKSAIQTV